MGTFEIKLNAFCVTIRLQAFGDKEGEHGGLHKNAAQRLIYLKT